jgi:hypothetical protein
MYKFDAKEHVHTLNGKYLTGTSSVVNVLSKPLTWWAAGLAVEKFGWKNPKLYTAREVDEAAIHGLERVKEMNLDEYQKLLADAYKAHSVKLKDSATKGTDLHEELEKFVKAEMGISKDYAFEPVINSFVQWSEKHVKRFLWSEAHCYSETMFVGGISDAGAELNNGQIALIDFKSSKDAYDSHFIQAAGYALQIEQNGLWDSSGKHTKTLDQPIDQLIIVPFGAPVVEPVIKFNVTDFKQGFVDCVHLYRLLGMDK